MKYITLHKLYTFSLILLIPLTILMFFAATVGKGGILNDFDKALIEIEKLEKLNLLDNPPEGTSRIALREIKLLHNSEGVRQYIKDLENDESGLWCSFFLFALTLGIFLIRRYVKKKSIEEKKKNCIKRSKL